MFENGSPRTSHIHSVSRQLFHCTSHTHNVLKQLPASSASRNRPIDIDSKRLSDRFLRRHVPPRVSALASAPVSATMPEKTPHQAPPKSFHNDITVKCFCLACNNEMSHYHHRFFSLKSDNRNAQENLNISQREIIIILIQIRYQKSQQFRPKRYLRIVITPLKHNKINTKPTQKTISNP